MLKVKMSMSILVMILVVTLTSSVLAKTFDVDARSAILIDAQSGQVLFAKNENIELPPASITKIMTALLAMEAIEQDKISMNEQVSISDLAESMGGSQIWIEEGEKIILSDLLKAIMIPSANDACVAVAEHIGGTEHNFVRMMNQKAKELGMNHTRFVNTTGLPVKHGDHHTTAYDIALMAKELSKYSDIIEFSKKRIDYIKGGELPIYTTNDLIGSFPGADGLKTGWTEEAGFCLAGTAKRGDLRLISVVMGAESKIVRVSETVKLLNYGFRAFAKAFLTNYGVEVTQVEVPKGKELLVPVETATEFYAMIERGTKDLVKEEVVKSNEKLEAPVKKGDHVGYLIFKKDDLVLGKVELVASKDVEKAGIFTLFWRWIVSFVMGFFKN